MSADPRFDVRPPRTVPPHARTGLYAPAQPSVIIPPPHRREAAENAEAAKQLAEDGAGPMRREAANVRAATWRVRAATLGAVCREAAKLWPEVSL